eukprot:CAMPEP_0117485070 /NCGR_PEP_ID=MMETSP0784-20121206/14780_1 /TAXON_ID=39447 /ORGANISM="" /LENGTH=88 /DNA_ID=CAMNT_0005279655 /DNA_START=654 /DNA_END=916 /DNA_ORIENTATION=+
MPVPSDAVDVAEVEWPRKKRLQRGAERDGTVIGGDHELVDGCLQAGRGDLNDRETRHDLAHARDELRHIVLEHVEPAVPRDAPSVVHG